MDQTVQHIGPLHREVDQGHQQGEQKRVDFRLPKPALYRYACDQADPEDCRDPEPDGRERRPQGLGGEGLFGAAGVDYGELAGHVQLRGADDDSLQNGRTPRLF